MTITRNTILASRHKELGSELEEWNNMGMPWTYDQDVNLEHQAIRNKACLFDLSGLKKVRVSGPDALQVLDHVCTRDLTLIYPGKSVYALLLDENGGITDDCIMFHIMPNCWMMVHGGGTAMEQLGKSAENKAVQISFDDDLHNLSLQGPVNEATKFLPKLTILCLYGIQSGSRARVLALFLAALPALIWSEWKLACSSILTI